METSTTLLIGIVIGLFISISLIVWYNSNNSDSEDPIKPID